jgi:hypothetical protein
MFMLLLTFLLLSMSLLLLTFLLLLMSLLLLTFLLLSMSLLLPMSLLAYFCQHPSLLLASSVFSASKSGIGFIQLVITG